MDYQNLRLAPFPALIAPMALLLSFLFIDAKAALPTYSAPQAGHMRAHFINVGQGSSVLLEFSCAAVLIDTGGEANGDFNSTDELQKYLKAFFARRSDLKETFALVLITHAHIDHTRGLPMVLSSYTVKSYVDNGYETGSGGRQQKAAHAKAKGNSAMSWQAITQPEVNEKGGLGIMEAIPSSCEGGKIQFHAMWGGLQSNGGWTSTVFNDQNNSSVVTQLKFGETSFLFMGDLEQDVHNAMLGISCPTPVIGPCPALQADLVHVAHHGSYNGTGPDVVTALSPTTYVMSMGPPDRNGMWTAVAYGHPRQVAVNMLLADTKLGSRTPAIPVKLATKAGTNKAPSENEFASDSMSKAIYATGWDGTVVIYVDMAHHLLSVDRAGLL
jgi:beta-lactamase superfamily II metal-dependent hydrolase